MPAKKNSVITPLLKGGGVTIDNKTQLGASVVWVCQAASNDESRYFMNGLHVEKTRSGKFLYVCTDGQRLHLFQCEDEILAPGEYYVKRCRKTEVLLEPYDVLFPNFRRILPKLTKAKKLPISINLSRFSSNWQFSVSKFLCQLGYLSKGKIALKLDLVKDIFSGDYHWTAYWQQNDPGKPVAFLNADKSKRAVIMPLLQE